MTALVFGLPETWNRVSEDVLAQALEKSLLALTPDRALEGLRNYFDENGNYAGALFNTIEVGTTQPEPENRITPGDLLAVATLAMDIGPLQARQLLTPGHPACMEAQRLLALIPTNVSLADAAQKLSQTVPTETALLSHMSDLQDTLRETGPLRKNHARPRNWVFAAKLNARKRPLLFPVRDNVVCKYLAPDNLSASGPGTFRHDIQVFAHLAVHEEIAANIQTLRAEAQIPATVPDLRVLDAALWLAAPR